MIILTMFYGNSGGSISQDEVLGLIAQVVIILIAILYMFIIYKFTVSKVKKIANI